ncbi:MAG: hypothetical protein ACYS8Z_05325 [Planctomycetota bacterium]
MRRSSPSPANSVPRYLRHGGESSGSTSWKTRLFPYYTADFFKPFTV